MKSIAKAEAKCCHKYERKGKSCGSCPLMAALGKKERKRLLQAARKRRDKAA